MTRAETIALLERVRAANVCAYATPGCDCKYGASLEGEQTGCPELRELIAMLGKLTDQDWSTLRAWAGLS